MSAPWNAIAPAIPTGTSLRTILQVQAATQERLVVDTINVTMNSVTATDVPVTFRLYVQTSAGTGGTSVTPTKRDQTAGTPTVSALRAPGAAWTAEPTAGDILDEWYIPATSGQVVLLPTDQAFVSAVNGRLAVVAIAPQTATVTVKMGGTCS